MDKQVFLEYCAKIREFQEYIIGYKHKIFPTGCSVLVNCDRYYGPGIVGYHTNQCPIDRIPVKLENGNTWYYLVECCERIDNV